MLAGYPPFYDEGEAIIILLCMVMISFSFLISTILNLSMFVRCFADVSGTYQKILDGKLLFPSHFSKK
jgi:hypothetical protein